MRKSWFFQANSAIYRIRDALAALPRIRWSVKQYASDIHVGDTVYLWESGPIGGLLAEMRVATEPYEGRDPPDEMSYYVTPPEEASWPGVDLDIVRKFESPLSQSQLLEDEILANTQLIRNPRGTNFPISEQEQVALSRRLDSARPTFREVAQRYFNEQVVFSSLEKGSLYCIVGVDERGCDVARLSAQEPARVTFSLHDARVQSLLAAHEPRSKSSIDNTVAVVATLLQSPEILLTKDRMHVVGADGDEIAVQVFCDHIAQLNVDRSSGQPKLYKPAMLVACIDAIEAGEITDHRLEFDILLPRFLTTIKEWGLEGGEQQASLAFFHLTSDLFWSLSYRSKDERVENVSPAQIRERVRHAVLKEPFRWLLNQSSIRKRVRKSILDAWFPKVPPMSEPKFWWVNQGQTYPQEHEAGIIWAPQADKGGKSNFHWDNVGNVKATDIVFHYANGSIVAVSQCTAAGVQAPKPASLQHTWQEDGWLAQTAYTELSAPIPLTQVAEPIRKIDFKYGPINKTNGVNQGYLFELPTAAARILAEQLDLTELPETVAQILRKLLADQWEAFIYWAQRFWADPKIRESERPYKLKISERLRESSQALLAGGDWYTPLRRAFQGENNLTNYRAHDKFLKWCQAKQDDAKAMLQSIWNPATVHAAAVASGLALLPVDAVPGAGTRNNLASFLAMGRDPTQCPIYKFDPFTLGVALTGFSPFKNLNEGQYYGHALSFLDRILREAAARNFALEDRLDAQCALWCITKYAPPDAWSPEDRAAFLDFRAGKTGMDDQVENPLQELADELYLDVQFLEEAIKLIESKRQLVFYGPPGTGKTFVAKALAKYLARGEGEVEIVQFHPSYAYEDFVEGYRPRLTNGQAGFRLARGPLRRLAKKARTHPDGTFVLLIDEINRGNIAKIFGELYFLLEYRDEDISLQYSSKRFSLPPNLWIIGTMNTADRSIALIDAALRRRFYFIPFFPDEPPVAQVLRRWLDANKPTLRWLADVVDTANTKLGNRHAAIGPSHFMRSDLDDDWLELIWKHAITPYLAEQFFGDEERVKDFELSKLRNSLPSDQ